MKSTRIVAVVVAAILIVAGSQGLPAAEKPSEAASQTPRDAAEVLNQIHLDVAIKQYEKILTAEYEADLERILGPADSNLTEEQRNNWKQRAEIKCKVLEHFKIRLRDEIADRVEKANALAKERAQVKAAAETKARTHASTTPAAA